MGTGSGGRRGWASRQPAPRCEGRPCAAGPAWRERELGPGRPGGRRAAACPSPGRAGQYRPRLLRESFAAFAAGPLVPSAA